MNKKVLYTLEYNKITEQLSAHASSDWAKEHCLHLKPMTDPEKIRQAQAETGAALSRIYRKGSISFSGIHKIGMSLKRLEVGGILSIEELLHIAALLDVAKRVKTYGRADRENISPDTLDAMFQSVEPLTPLCTEIRRCIISEEEIADDASSRLKSIRRSIQGMSGRIHNQISNILNHSTTRTYLQDAVVTMRNGRYCLPVKAEYKNQISGMIHDQSSSGSTLFIEPASIVNLNNELKELYLKEQEEIEKIIAELSNQVAVDSETLLNNYKLLTTLDFIFAKAELAHEQNGVAPEFNTQGRIYIRRGRHPLLHKKSVVPIDVRLGDDFQLLVVTGPNTGGKTVSLKTVGLLTLMGQAGLHIPAGDRSQLAVFENVYADIGDEQSIEQSLSTFSSHMTNIVTILKKVTPNSLVLFDELCSGTDPTEGAALAISILSRLLMRGVRVMATTHYSELKVFALSTEGVQNACCEFDVETLSPTYRLLIGIPGKSNAFAISGKLGLTDDIIADAKTRITSNEQNFEDLIADLEASRKTIEKERLEIEQYKQELAKLHAQAATKQEKLDNRRDKIIQEANEQALAILKEAKEAADASIRNFHKYGTTNPTASDLEKERAALRSRMNDAESRIAKTQKQPAANNKVPKKLRLGDSVRVLSMNQRGTVSTLPNAKGDLFVQMGILRTQVNIKDLVLIEDETTSSSKKSAKTGAGKIRMSKASSISAEVMLIGKTVDEAIMTLDKYLDDAYLSHLSTVRVVHGKGTGALRNAVHQHLRRIKYVDSFHLGEFGEGDSGVTIVEFK
uniref:Endonuclease MutS2 n=1 Tax=Eubacterium plexicaudatum ASF492 TaxID=1235802 RepID=N2AHD1_9FIRM